MCPQGQWEKVAKGAWARSMSPFDHKLLDVRTAGSALENFEVSIEEGKCSQLYLSWWVIASWCAIDPSVRTVTSGTNVFFSSVAEFFAYRIGLLISGIILLSLASFLSKSLAFYYGSAMAIGIILVILMILYQVTYFCSSIFWNLESFICNLIWCWGWIFLLSNQPWLLCQGKLLLCLVYGLSYLFQIFVLVYLGWS